MSKAKELQEKAEMFERRAESATDPMSRRHYKEMAAHYRSLAVEHLDVTATSRRTEVGAGLPAQPRDRGRGGAGRPSLLLARNLKPSNAGLVRRQLCARRRSS